MRYLMSEWAYEVNDLNNREQNTHVESLTLVDQARETCRMLNRVNQLEDF